MSWRGMWPWLGRLTATPTICPEGAEPDLDSELINAIMAALEAHTTMSTQALNSAIVQRGLKDVLLRHLGLFEALREKAETQSGSR